MNTKMIRAISRDTWETWIRMKIPAKNAVTPYGIKEAISPISTEISGFFSFVINPTFALISQKVRNPTRNFTTGTM